MVCTANNDQHKLIFPVVAIMFGFEREKKSCLRDSFFEGQ